MANNKKKFQFKGKQILMLGLVALVITAGYYRWTVEQDKLTTAVTTANDSLPADSNSQDENENSIKKLKQDRDSARSQSLEEWKKLTSSSDASVEAKKEAEKKITLSTENAEKERQIETKVIAKGFDDCIAYVDEKSVAVTIKGENIDGSKIAQIKDIIVDETNIPVKNIKINVI